MENIHFAIAWNEINDINNILLSPAISSDLLHRILHQRYKGEDGLLVNNKKLWYMDTPLTVASRYGRYELVKLIIDLGGDIDVVNIHGVSALMTACYHNYSEIPKFLIGRNADIHQVDVDGKSALLWSCIDNNIEMVTHLLSEGSSCDAVNTNGDSALHFAACSGYAEISGALLTAGCNFAHTLNKNGYTPVAFASLHGRMNVMLVFVMHGIDIYQQHQYKAVDEVDDVEAKGTSIIHLYGNDRHEDPAMYDPAVHWDINHMDRETKISQQNIIIDAYRREWNWRRRKDCLQFFINFNYFCYYPSSPCKHIDNERDTRSNCDSINDDSSRVCCYIIDMIKGSSEKHDTLDLRMLQVLAMRHIQLSIFSYL